MIDGLEFLNDAYAGMEGYFDVRRFNNDIRKDNLDLALLGLNIRSIWNKIDELQGS